MLASDLSFDIDTINECIRELSEDRITDRKDYFNLMVVERIDRCNREYMNDFDNELSKIMEAIDNNCSIVYIAKLINKISRVTRGLYNSEITLYKVL